MLCRALVFAALVVVGGACNLSDVVLIDQGRACLGEQTVSVSACISACAEDVRARCSVQVAGDRIEIHSEISYQDSSDACIALCGQAEATCAMPALTRGSYAVVHGDDTGVLEVGADTAAVCLGGS
jgi:hypothetical protein